MENAGIKITKKDAQSLQEFLAANDYLARGLRPAGSKLAVVFPLSEKGLEEIDKIKKKFPKARKSKVKFGERNSRPKNIKEAVRDKLSAQELAILPSSFDTLGDCAILELPDELVGKTKIIAQGLMEVNSSVKSVFLKIGAHQGVFREEPVKFVAGVKTDKATYVESGCTFRISLGKVFFSPRLSTERKRIAALIKKGEHVAALFAGVGPFPIVFAKKSQMEMAVAIELNPAAVENMFENISINKVGGKVEPVLGDVNALAAKYAGQFDRAVMPLPKSGEDFLESAIKYIRLRGGVVHYYQFVDRANPFEVPEKQIAVACASLGRKFRVLVRRKVREYSPEIIQVVVDFWVEAK